MARRTLQRGLTILELLLAVVVIAILVALAVPAYRQHAMREQRVDATRELRLLADRLARCHALTGSYLRLDDVPNACVVLPYTISEGTYRITGSIAASTFLLNAAPLGSQAADAACNALTLDQQGRAAVTGSGVAADCWGVPR